MGETACWSDEDQTYKEHRVRLQAPALACKKDSKQIFPEFHSNDDFLPLSRPGAQAVRLGRSLRKSHRRLRSCLYSSLCRRMSPKACGFKITLLSCSLELPRFDDGGIWLDEHHQRVYLLRCETNVGNRHKSGENPQSLPVERKNLGNETPRHLDAKIRASNHELGQSHDFELHLFFCLGRVLIRNCQTLMAIRRWYCELLESG